MRSSPVVLLTYNRPDKARQLINGLRASQPRHVIFSVDGPRANKPGDAEKVAAVQALASEINWPTKLETRFRPVNLGLRAAVTDAVSSAVSQYGSAIVLEEDTIPGPLWVPYAEYHLEKFADQPKIEHISGYNLVPERILANPLGSRLTRYPASFAWATWERAWSQFDSSLTWAREVEVRELAAFLQTFMGALRWKQNFSDADHERISTWAYRWINSMWQRNAYCLSPNQNLVTYTGYDEGTHTIMKAPWTELPLYDSDLQRLLSENPQVDAAAEKWVNDVVFRGTTYGVARGVLITAALAARKAWRSR